MTFRTYGLTNTNLLLYIYSVYDRVDVVLFISFLFWYVLQDVSLQNLQSVSLKILPHSLIVTVLDI